MAPLEFEVDSLSSLEERIQRAVLWVAQLRQEKVAAVEAAAEAKAAAERLAQQVKTLEAERKQVRSRIEKLLGQIDQLGGN
jgi:FtsZ-binding cell division protein ZapB